MTLNEFIQRQRLGKGEFAKKMKVCPSTVSHWCSGRSRPRPKQVRRFEHLWPGIDFIEEMKLR